MPENKTFTVLYHFAESEDAFDRGKNPGTENI
jgi:hypothetical protein